MAELTEKIDFNGATYPVTKMILTEITDILKSYSGKSVPYVVDTPISEEEANISDKDLKKQNNALKKEVKSLKESISTQMKQYQVILADNEAYEEKIATFVAKQELKAGGDSN